MYWKFVFPWIHPERAGLKSMRSFRNERRMPSKLLLSAPNSSRLSNTGVYR